MHGIPHESRLFDLSVYSAYYIALLTSLDWLRPQYMKWNNEGNRQKINVQELTNIVSR
jgi:hypothetical protein